MKAIHCSFFIAWMLLGSDLYAQELVPQAGCHAAKIFNTSETPIQCKYQFGKSGWRSISIQSGGSIYLYDPQQRLPLQFWAALPHGSFQYTLETLAVYGVSGLEDAASFERNDEAQLYHFGRDVNDRVILLNGFPKQWIAAASRQFTNALAKSNVNVMSFSRPIDPRKSDTLICELEFRAACEVLTRIYRDHMHTTSAPYLDLEWRPTSRAYVLEPVISIHNCDSKTGAEFLKEVVDGAMGNNPDWKQLSSFTTCRTTEVVLAPRVHKDFQKDGRLDLVSATQAFMSFMNTRTSLAADHPHVVNDHEHRICSQWRQLQQGSSWYRWKAVIILSEDAEQNASLQTEIVAQKLVYDKWERLASLQVHNLGDLDTRGFDPEHFRRGVPVTTEDSSRAALLATAVSVKLSNVLTNGRMALK